MIGLVLAQVAVFLVVSTKIEYARTGIILADFAVLNIIAYPWFVALTSHGGILLLVYILWDLATMAALFMWGGKGRGPQIVILWLFVLAHTLCYLDVKDGGERIIAAHHDVLIVLLVLQMVSLAGGTLHAAYADNRYHQHNRRLSRVRLGWSGRLSRRHHSGHQEGKKGTP